MKKGLLMTALITGTLMCASTGAFAEELQEYSLDQMVVTATRTEKKDLDIPAVVEVYSEKTGIALDVSTDLPGIQFYSGNYLQDMTGKQGKIYHDRDGFALETEYYPDSVNKPAFAQPVLKAGETFSSDTVYRLSYRK